MPDRETNRSHRLALAHAGKDIREPDPPDVFYQHGSELDWLNGLSEPLRPNEIARRDVLRRARERGSIADEGEVWCGYRRTTEAHSDGR